ncbi:MAG: tannase/feruloyl esterase family alpha/beta hydrolase [Acidisphaera sp.]|nr:tannase/feruloyl esterase family alpha/beta hydrolase [Acidisphaera sp.]MBV9811879.1 tannase/feruloyl esterase family alpha/beta hydrolase [Acetobacteraceae bacterium]
MRRKTLLMLGVAAWAGGAALLRPSYAEAATACTQPALSGLNVDGVAIVSATPVSASGTTPAFCDVVGNLNTSGGNAPPGSANFELRLPQESWNQKFVFLGVGGLAGTISVLSANPVDTGSALGRGYVTMVTDTGHQAGSTDASWALIHPNVPAQAKVMDYLYRATHDATVAGKLLATRFYAQPLRYAYFDGCSNGGHQGLTEAADYPGDYDGIIAGAPFFDVRALLASVRFAQQQLSSPAAYLPASKLPMIDNAVVKSCDAVDGVSDGLIQNPAKCSFDPRTLLCHGDDAPDCLTAPQVETLATYLTATRDATGGLVYPGWSVAALTGGADAWSIGRRAPIDAAAPEPWGNAGFAPAPLGWQFADHFIKSIVARDPSYDIRSFPLTALGEVPPDALAVFDARLGVAMRPGATAGFNPAAADYTPYLNGHGKILLYHGLADPALSPFRTEQLYAKLASISDGGYARLRQSARLFMVPGMQHCGFGPGPNRFDTLTPLEQWVERGVAPAFIAAEHHADNDPAKPVDRSMPLCPFPQQAEYRGSGDVTDGANWSCTNNARMLELGLNGWAAGL